MCPIFAIIVERGRSLASARVATSLYLYDRIAFELICEFNSGHHVFTALKITKRGAYKSRGYSNDSLL